MVSFDFAGKVALVTGAGSGMGRSAALAFAQAGAVVVVADRKTAAGEETVSLIDKLGARAHFISVDVSDSKAVASMVDEAADKLGGLHYAFNNAGIDGTSAYAPIADGDEGGWDQVIDINLKGVWLCLKHEIRHMAAHGGGAIVNNASIGGFRGLAGLSPYVASKHGVVGLTRTAAIEYARAGIRVNAVAPGAIKTPMFDRGVSQDPNLSAAIAEAQPMGRVGQPEEVARAVIWLCSDQASYVTGECLSVDGGFLAR